MKSNVSKRCAIFISVCIFICLIVCLSVFVNRLYSTRDYKCTDGKIVKIDKEIEYSVGENDPSSYYKVDISYEVNNKQYTVSQNYKFKFGLREGKSINVYYDELNPEIVRDNNQVLIFVIVLMFIFFIFSIDLIKNSI